MKNLIDTKKSLVTALSRYGRVLSLMIIGLALSSSAFAKTYYLDATSIVADGYTVAINWLQTQGSSAISYSTTATTGKWSFNLSEGSQFKMELKLTKNGSDYYKQLENITASSEYDNCAVSYNGSSLSYVWNSGSAPTTTVPSILIAQKPTVSGSTATINLQLSDWGCTAVSAVKVYYTTNGDTPTTSSSVWNISTSQNSNAAFSVQKSGLSSGTYKIKVAAVNEKGEGALSDEATFTVSGCDAPTLTAAYNTNRKAATTSSFVATVGISAIGTCSYTEFGVEYSKSSTFTSSTKQAVSPKPTTTGNHNVALTGLDANTKYYFRAYANTSSGYVYSDTKYDYTKPNPVSSFENVTSNSVLIKGKFEVGGNNISTVTKLVLQVSTDNTWATKESKNYSNATAGTEYSFTFAGLTSNTKYYYKTYIEYTDLIDGTTKCSISDYSESQYFTTLSEFISVTIDATATVCAGSTVTPSKSSDPVADSWTFTSSDETVATVDANGVVTGVAAGSATITATAHKTGYEDKSATCAVTVNAVPAQPGAITGTENLCAGTNDNAFSITAVSGATGYTWSKSGEGDFTVSGDGINCTVNTGASYNGGTLQVIATNGCGSSAPRTLSLTKVADPTVSLSASAASVCAGANVTITATTTDVTTHSWTMPNEWTKLSENKDEAVYTTAGSGSKKITYMGRNSCGVEKTGSADVSVKIIPTLNIAAPADACGAGDITFTSSNVTTGAEVHWFENSTEVGIGTTKTYSNVPAGEPKSVKANAELNGCTSDYTDVVTGNRLSVPTLTITVASTAVTAGEANKTYGWEEATISASTDSGSITSSSISQTTGTGGIISGNTVKGHVDDVFTGSYTATGSNGCTSSDSQTVTVIKAAEVCP